MKISNPIAACKTLFSRNALMSSVASMNLIVASPLPVGQYPENTVLEYNGSTAVFIGPNHLITARHNGYNSSIRPAYNMSWDETPYRVVEQYLPDNYFIDLQIVRFEPATPHWAKLGFNPLPAGQPMYLGAWGQTVNADGTNYAFPRAQRWGTNRTDYATGGTNSYITFTYDPPTSPSALANESHFAMNDSGGGVFAPDENGEFRLYGVAETAGGVTYGGYSRAISVSLVRAWIENIIYKKPDWNRDGIVGQQDLFDFLADFHQLRGDYNRNGTNSVQDLFDFLTDYNRALLPVSAAVSSMPAITPPPVKPKPVLEETKPALTSKEDFKSK